MKKVNLWVATPPLFAAVLVALSSCSTLPVGGRPPAGDEKERRLQIVRYARSLLGKKDLSGLGPHFRNDCSGLVLGVYRSLGYEVEITRPSRNGNLSDGIYRTLNQRGLTYVSFTPQPADLVFFKGTVVGGGDAVTHVGIVDGIGVDGTVLILNYTSPGVTELRMNLLEPHVYRDKYGEVKNDFLKQKPQGGNGEKLLSGELFFSFGDLLKYAQAIPGPVSDNLFE